MNFNFQDPQPSQEKENNLQPPDAYKIFFNSKKEEIQSDPSKTLSEWIKEIEMRWHGLSDEEQQVYVEEAEKMKNNEEKAKNNDTTFGSTANQPATSFSFAPTQSTFGSTTTTGFSFGSATTTPATTFSFGSTAPTKQEYLDDGLKGESRPLLNVGVFCDHCGKSNFLGQRWKCQICDDFDLCEECHKNTAAAIQHNENFDSHFFEEYHKTTQPTTSEPVGFSFEISANRNTSATTATQPTTTGFNFGSATTAPVTTGFSFGSTQPSTSAFASTAIQPTTTGFGFRSATTAPATTQTATSGFGVPQSATATGFNFGSATTAPITTKATTGFNFGSTQPTSTAVGFTATNGLRFGSTVNQPASTGFSFASTQPTTSAFGSTTQTPFGSNRNQPTGFSFASTTTNQPEAKSKPETATSGFSFSKPTVFNVSGFNFGKQHTVYITSELGFECHFNKEAFSDLEIEISIRSSSSSTLRLFAHRVIVSHASDKLKNMFIKHDDKYLIKIQCDNELDQRYLKKMFESIYTPITIPTEDIFVMLNLFEEYGLNNQRNILIQTLITECTRDVSIAKQCIQNLSLIPRIRFDIQLKQIMNQSIKYYLEKGIVTRSQESIDVLRHLDYNWIVEYFDSCVLSNADTKLLSTQLLIIDLWVSCDVDTRSDSQILLRLLETIPNTAHKCPFPFAYCMSFMKELSEPFHNSYPFMQHLSSDTRLNLINQIAQAMTNGPIQQPSSVLPSIPMNVPPTQPQMQTVPYGGFSVQQPQTQTQGASF